MAYTSDLKHSGIIRVKVNNQWIDLPDPQTMTYSVYDLDSEDGTGRNQNGELFRDRRAIKEKLTCTFPPMKAQNLIYMLSLVKQPFFQARYFSPYYNTMRETTMYVGDRTAPNYYMYDSNNLQNNWYQAISMNLIER